MRPKAASSAAHIKCAGQKYNKKRVMQANSKIHQFIIPGLLSLLHDANPPIITGKENYSFLSFA
jgi:hypothetical protein